MLVRLDGSPRYAMSVQVVAAILNIFLDWLMVFPLGMGIAGASIATSFSCIVGGLMVVVYFLRFSSRLKFYRLKATRKSLMLSLRNVGYMANIGFATFCYGSRFGYHDRRVTSCSCRCLARTALLPIQWGAIFSGDIFHQQCRGPVGPAHNKLQLRGEKPRACASGIAPVAPHRSLVRGGCFACDVVRSASALSLVFLPAEAVAYGLAVHGLPLLGLSAVCFSLNIVFIGYFQSIEQSARSTVYTILRGAAFLVPAFILLPLVLGVDGLWLAIPAAEMLTLMVILVVILVSSRQKFGSQG